MALTKLHELLEEASSVLDLARILGERCLVDAGELRAMRDEKETAARLKRLESLVSASSCSDWEDIVVDPTRLPHYFVADFFDELAIASTRQPLDLYGVLRGLCARPLMEFFEQVRAEPALVGPIELVTGMPIIFATRPLPTILQGSQTPGLETLHGEELLSGLPFSLYRPGSEDGLRVVLDYSHADRLDDLTWSHTKGLPRIATIHPANGHQYTIDRLGDNRFFGVRPQDWDLQKIKECLALAKDEGAQLAVLPELSMPAPDALEEELALNRTVYPPIVVAGSAHFEMEEAVSGLGTRANESRTYLDGSCIAVARKNHRFKTDTIGDKTFSGPQVEDLTNEPKTLTVLSGAKTRLAVVVCADLVERDIPRLLVDAGVNLLVVPSMTSKLGSFNAPLADIASLCQGVAVVANALLNAQGDPFLLMCATPHQKPEEQTAACRPSDGTAAPHVAIFDPNKPLPGAVSWP